MPRDSKNKHEETLRITVYMHMHNRPWHPFGTDVPTAVPTCSVPSDVVNNFIHTLVASKTFQQFCEPLKLRNTHEIRFVFCDWINGTLEIECTYKKLLYVYTTIPPSGSMVGRPLCVWTLGNDSRPRHKKGENNILPRLALSIMRTKLVVFRRQH